jgi:DNA-binding NarL/FixJ family response regulator
MPSTSDKVSQPVQGRTSIMLVDDHTSIRQMLAFLLPREGPYDIVAQASSGLEALEICRAVKPMVMILDIMLPELSGIEIIRRLYSEKCETRTLVYSGTENADLIADVMRSKPHGFVHKEDSLDTLRLALKTVSAGSSYIAATAMSVHKNLAVDVRSLLSDNEIAVLQMLAEGLQQKVIADRIQVSVRTVEHYRASLSEKLGIGDIPGLTKYAIRHGLTSM